MPHSRKRPSAPQINGTALDDLLEDVGPVASDEFFAVRANLNGTRALAVGVLRQAALDLERYRLHCRGQQLSPEMLDDGWTPAAGREADAWFREPGDEVEPFTLAWVRSTLRCG